MTTFSILSLDVNSVNFLEILATQAHASVLSLLLHTIQLKFNNLFEFPFNAQIGILLVFALCRKTFKRYFIDTVTAAPPASVTIAKIITIQHSPTHILIK